MICCIIPVLDISLQEPRFFCFFFSPSSLSSTSFPLSVAWPAMQSHYASHLHCWKVKTKFVANSVPTSTTLPGNDVDGERPINKKHYMLHHSPSRRFTARVSSSFFLFFFFHLLFLPLLCRWCHLPCRATVQVTVQTCTVESSKQNLWQTASWHLAASCFHLWADAHRAASLAIRTVDWTGRPSLSAASPFLLLSAARNCSFGSAMSCGTPLVLILGWFHEILRSFELTWIRTKATCCMTQNKTQG